MKINLLRLALKNIGSRRTRSWLTILGVLVGVTAVASRITLPIFLPFRDYCNLKSSKTRALTSNAVELATQIEEVDDS